MAAMEERKPRVERARLPLEDGDDRGRNYDDFAATQRAAMPRRNAGKNYGDEGDEGNGSDEGKSYDDEGKSSDDEGGEVKYYNDFAGITSSRRCPTLTAVG